MQIVTGKPLFESTLYENLRDVIFYARKEYASLDAFVFRKDPEKAEIHKTYEDFGRDVEYLGTALIERGFSVAHISVIGENAYEWMVSYCAALSCGAVGVPLDRLLPEMEVVSLLQRGKVKVLFYHPKLHSMINSIAARTDIPTKLFICMDKSLLKEDFPDSDAFLDLSDLLAQGKNLVNEGDARLREHPIDNTEVKIILFTSGTTSTSKGVMLTHKNICHNIYRIGMTIKLFPGERAFSILPLHHTFENTCDLHMLSKGVCICFSDGLRYLLKNITEWHPEIIISVPLLFESVYSKIMAGIEEKGKTGTIRAAVTVTRFLRNFHVDIRKKVFKDILDKLGGHLRIVMIGGAAMEKTIIQSFNDFGIDFFMGYGLTETSPVISATTKEKNIYGSIGPPIAGVTVAIDTEEKKPGAVGEVLTKSECVMQGYYENPEATAEVFTEDGWFKTGDMGYIDKHGCIHLTGRVKSMIVLSNGKKAFPEEMETLINVIPGVKEAFVWGEEDGKNVEICAKISIDRKEIGVNLPVPEKTPGDIAIGAYLKEKIKEINRQMPSFKSIHYFVFTEEDLIKTTTLKVKRRMELESVHTALKKAVQTMKGANGQSIDTI